MSLLEVRAQLKVCKDKCNYYRKHGQRFRSNHLKNRLDKAQERGDEVAEKQILAIILGEKQRRHWRKLNYGMGKSFGRSARIVSEETEGGNILKHEGKENVEEAIRAKIHDERFYLAEEAPICNGKLKGEFGYLVRTDVVKKVLDGTYSYANDFDEATREYLQECARTRAIVPENSVDTVLTSRVAAKMD